VPIGACLCEAGREDPTVGVKEAGGGAEEVGRGGCCVDGG